jgi:hypothetical protein
MNVAVGIDWVDMNPISIVQRALLLYATALCHVALRIPATSSYKYWMGLPNIGSAHDSGVATGLKHPASTKHITIAK